MKNRLNKKLSLLKECQICKNNCCIAGDLCGTPILSAEEAEEIKRSSLKDGSVLSAIISSSGQRYFIIQEEKGRKRCSFLSLDNKCLIQDIKPLDCLCYPVKAVYKQGKIKFIIDGTCPAAQNLSENFIKNAKKIALESIRRFDPNTYTEFLKNYSIWVWQDTAKEI
ncbi:MAG: hypothetical protein M1127_00160 [Patescibacteria group bacterium]|nr:hypothetical protein [Patescibacteria group bacterium]